MTNNSETVREVCAEMCKDYYKMGRSNARLDTELMDCLKSFADRLLSAHEREMAAKDERIKILEDDIRHLKELSSDDSFVHDHLRKNLEEKDDRIALLERALKGVMECNSDFDSCAWMGDQLDEEQMDAVDGLHTAVREAQRIMKEGEEK